MDIQTQRLEKYRAHLARSGKSEHTLKAYLSDVRAFLKWYRHVTDTPDTLSVDPRDIQDYRAYLVLSFETLSPLQKKLRYGAFLWYNETEEKRWLNYR